MRTIPTITFLGLLSVLCAAAQPQVAWVARYNGGFSSKGHTPLALKLDATGSLYVAGSSLNGSNVSDYVVLKYASSGTELYVARYSSTNGVQHTATGFALDQAGNTYVTGTGGTVKFDVSGVLVWLTPFAGKDVVVDTNGNVYVTGFSAQQFATVKLSASGSNLWVRSYANSDGVGGVWRTESQKVAVGVDGQVYVAGWEAWGPPFRCGENYCRYFRPALLMYDPTGSCLWTNAYTGGGLNWGETKMLIPGSQGIIYVTANGDSTYQTARINVSGQIAWTYQYGGSPGVNAMALDVNGNTYLTGGVYSGFAYGTFKLDSSGNVLWQTNYFGTTPDYSYNQAKGITLEANGSIYVTGISTNGGTANDFATIKYDNGGQRQWLIRYNGPANGNDGATSIAVSSDGAIYVTGYSANASGGSDITTIKYAYPTTIQKKTDGSMQLQGFGTPGTNYAFECTTNFLSWSPLGTALADTNGLFQYLDTNAPLFPYRFYRWHQP